MEKERYFKFIYFIPQVKTMFIFREIFFLSVSEYHSFSSF